MENNTLCNNGKKQNKIQREKKMREKNRNP